MSTSKKIGLPVDPDVAKKNNMKLLNEIDKDQENINELEKRLAELQKSKNIKVEQLKPNLEFPKDEEDNFLVEDWWNSIQFEPDYGIPVVNLLNMATYIVCGKYGSNAFVYVLEGFGTRTVIPYERLVMFVENHLNFITEGKVMILSDDFLKKHDLKKYTNKILNLDVLKAIFNQSLSAQDAIQLIKSCPENQKNEIIKEIVDRLANNPNFLDAQTVSIMSRELNYDFSRKANELSIYLDVLYGRVSPDEGEVF